MTETPTLPQLQQTAFPRTSDALANGVPTVSDVPATGAGPAKRPPTTQRRTSRVMIPALIIAIVANLAIITVIARRGDSASAIPVQPRPLPAGPPALTSPRVLPPALATTFGEGRFVVGSDIAPGTYQTTGKSGHKDCYWERLKDTNDGTASIIANDLVPGPATVTIDKTDAVFQTRWCSAWTKVS